MFASDAAGNPLAASAVGNPFTYTGQRHDWAVGLHHFRHRSYSPRLGRWMQHDPAGYVDGVSLYQYVKSDPSGKTDKVGLWHTPSPADCDQINFTGFGTLIALLDPLIGVPMIITGVILGATEDPEDSVFQIPGWGASFGSGYYPPELFRDFPGFPSVGRPPTSQPAAGAPSTGPISGIGGLDLPADPSIYIPKDWGPLGAFK